MWGFSPPPPLVLTTFLSHNDQALDSGGVEYSTIMRERERERERDLWIMSSLMKDTCTMFFPGVNKMDNFLTLN